MTVIKIEIEVDEERKFHEVFDALSPLRQKIWLKLVWYVYTFPIVKPSQSTIARACHCSRQAVSEAFRIFKAHSWMVLISRGWMKSKTILISDHLMSPEMYKNRGIKRVVFPYERATYGATHIKTSIKDKKTSTTGEFKPEPKIQEHLKKLDIPFDAKLKLSTLSQDIYTKALESCQKKAVNGFKPDNPIAYFIGTAFKIAEKENFKPNWSVYYRGKS